MFIYALLNLIADWVLQTGFTHRNSTLAPPPANAPQIPHQPQPKFNKDLDKI